MMESSVDEISSPCLLPLPEFIGITFTDGHIARTDSNDRNYLDDVNRLLMVCEKHVTKETFSAVELAENVIMIARACQGSHDELQSQLFELVGERGIEFIFEITPEAALLFRLGSLTMSPSEVLSRYGRSSNNCDEKTSSSNPFDDIFGGEYGTDWLAQAGFDSAYLSRERSLGLQGGSARGNLDNWRDNLLPEGSRVYHEKKGLPAGTERKQTNEYEEVIIPAPPKPDVSPTEVLFSLDSLEDWAQLAFPGTKKLNRIQSKVFETAYYSSENMLVCAPTGAGKTNIAMLTFLQLLKQHISDGVLDKDSVKAVYIAPMKALAQEVVAKFSERLEPLGLVVREFTGDMQLTRQEVAESHLLVSTPEKYDVTTRKGGEGSLGTVVSLIIIDEVHLLAEERGAVIETVVARTQRYIESSQRRVRLVGLSATLPNYQDVASFLRVNPTSGLFFFGPEYRPVPLDLTFVGVKEKKMQARNTMMIRVAYDKTMRALERGKQVMVFVHSRKETSRTAEALRDLAHKEGTAHMLENFDHEQYSLWKRQVDKSRSKEVQSLFYQGLGVHHAGMLRADRSMTERMFECGLIKVLCCTATLAWGVNLPAHTVIIKGTELYDPERGGFVDVSILDVLQIFGRAGRPQYDSTGHAILITPHKTLDKYLGLIGQQAPIESSLIKSLADHMNAEIVNGTINNIKEAASWLAYTFLFVRMRLNPMAYGMSYDEKFEDPQLEKKRVELVEQAARTLDVCMMSRYDPKSGNLGVTELGRIASHYYIKYGTIEAFNAMLTSHLNDSEALHVLCSSAEFDQLKLRPEELAEVELLRKEATTIGVKGSLNETSAKVNVLLQGYLNHSRVNSFTLQSDTNYVAQNAGRITRALFEICLKKGWSTMALLYLNLCKSIDRRVRSDQTPLRQFYNDELPKDVITRLEYLKTDVNTLLDMQPGEIGQLCHNHKIGSKILSLVKKLPHLHIDVTCHPLTRGVIRLSLTVSIDFEWCDRYHGFGAEPFWIWVEDGENEYIYHTEYFLLHRKQRHETHKMEFTIPIREPLPPQYYIRATSDRWVGCQSATAVSFQHLLLPDRMPPHTDLLDVHPMPRVALKNPAFEALYRFSHFNPVQSQAFHALYHTDVNILLGAPTGSGKTIVAELAILRLLNTRPGAKAIYVAPLKALARERLEDWRQKLGRGLGLNILELTGDNTPEMSALNKANLLVVTPEKWDSISRGWQRREYVQRVELVIIDEIHLLGVDRGPVLEIIVSRMRFVSCQTASPIRFVGLSTALANPRDLADWLGIGKIGLYNFRPAVRPIPMSIHVSGFPGKHYCPRMATMNKPAYASIKEHSPTKPALIFVSSRRQTRLTALDLISFCAADDNPKQFLHMPEDEIANIAGTLRDQALKDTIVFGIAIHHAGLDSHDRKVVEELFHACKVQVLVCTSTLAWGVNLPCHLVIVKGTEYMDAKLGRYVDFPVTDVLQMIGRAGRPQFDDSGVACVFVHDPKKNFYIKFLFEPFPVESSLHTQLHEHINAEVVSGVLTKTQDCLEFLSWTYYFRRLAMNPCYYLLEDISATGVKTHLTKLVEGVIHDLEEAGCLAVEPTQDEDNFKPTLLGKITSSYYLTYRTVGHFRSKLLELSSEYRGVSYAHILADSNLEEIIVSKLARVLCDAPEFSELPVRHNEDGLNAEMAKLAPWSVVMETCGSPHTKAFLLLQAHLFTISLPIMDYINDTKTVLDQVPRVLGALIEVTADMSSSSSRLPLLLCLVKLSQMIVQGAGMGMGMGTFDGARKTDGKGVVPRHDLDQLPSLSERQYQLLVDFCKSKGRDGTKGGASHPAAAPSAEPALIDIVMLSPAEENNLATAMGAAHMRQPPTHLQPQVVASGSSPKRVGGDKTRSSWNNNNGAGINNYASKAMAASSNAGVLDFFKALRNLPAFDLQIQFRRPIGSGITIGGGHEWIDMIPSPLPSAGSSQSSSFPSHYHSSSSAVKLAPNTEYQLEMRVKRVRGDPKAHVFAPKSHKPKSISHWISLSFTMARGNAPVSDNGDEETRSRENKSGGDGGELASEGGFDVLQVSGEETMLGFWRLGAVAQDITVGTTLPCLQSYGGKSNNSTNCLLTLRLLNDSVCGLTQTLVVPIKISA